MIYYNIVDIMLVYNNRLRILLEYNIGGGRVEGPGRADRLRQRLAPDLSRARRPRPAGTLLYSNTLY